MEPIKITVIPIWPATNVRSTQGDRWLFSVSDEYLAGLDQKRLEEHGKIGRLVARKHQLEKYNAYKEEVRYWVEKNNFVIKEGYFAIWFNIPFPPSWRKPKRAEMDQQAHLSTPDLDNLIKAIFDSIMPRRNRSLGQKGADDRRIHCYAPFKRWCQPGKEKIVIVEYDRDEYMSLFSHQEVLQALNS